MRDVNLSHFVKVIAEDETKHEPSVLFLNVKAKDHNEKDEFGKQSKLEDAIVAQESDITSQVLQDAIVEEVAS